MKSVLCLILVVVAVVGAHKLKSGECPRAEPMAGFDVKKVKLYLYICMCLDK